MTKDKTAPDIKLDERNRGKKPLLDQFVGLDWEILDLDNKQHPGDTFRETFTGVVMLPVMWKQLKDINYWLSDRQMDRTA